MKTELGPRPSEAFKGILSCGCHGGMCKITGAKVVMSLLSSSTSL